eukprot:6348645-Amphidinium_carterae.1
MDEVGFARRCDLHRCSLRLDAALADVGRSHFLRFQPRFQKPLSREIRSPPDALTALEKNYSLSKTLI